MRQLLLRIPDDLHARLTAKAKREGISVNALANKALHSAAPSEGPADGVTTRRYRLKERAREMGILVESPAPPVTPQRFSAALRETEGIGPVVAELWTKGR